MKSLSKTIAVTALLAGSFMVGCKNNLPTNNSYPTNPKNYTTVANFDSPVIPTPPKTTTGDYGAVNPTLLGAEANPGTTSFLLTGDAALGFAGGLQTLTTWFETPYNKPFVGKPPSGDSSLQAIHIIDTFLDPGDGTSYPTDQIRIRLTMSGYYDLTNFSGLNFMMYTTPRVGNVGDDALKRRFGIAVGATLPASDDASGYSNNLKRNNFGVVLSSTNGGWSQLSYAFTDMTQEAGYALVTPSDFAGHMKEVIWLQWSEGRNNAAGLCDVDFWIDQVSFY